MLRNKYFWIVLVILVPFIAIWITEGIGWAITTFVLASILFVFVLVATRRRRRHYDYYDDYDDYRRRKPTRARSDIQRAADWHIPKVNKDGAEFITGASSLRRTQQNAMRRTKKNLWG